jgi:peptidyl-prolyl cis-trans isomerase C
MALAKQHSKCPSGKSAGGKLGTFRPGEMVPPFNKAVFDKENKVGECIGPIQTNFGWHLIWIEDRNLVD